MTAAKSWCLRRNAVVLDLGDNAYVAMALGGETLALSRSAYEIHSLAISTGVEGAKRGISARYNVPEARVARDMKILKQRLCKAGILTRPGRHRPTARRFVAMVLAKLCADGIARATSPIRQAEQAICWARRAVMLADLESAIQGWCDVFGRSSDKQMMDCRPDLDALHGGIRRQALGVDCKVTSLAAFALLRHLGQPATLHVGVRPYPLRAHAWCELAGIAVTDDSEMLLPMTEAFRFPDGSP